MEQRPLTMNADPALSTHTVVAPEGADIPPLAFGSTVGRFLIFERLGTGGMGEVYRAEDTQLKRTVAIKRLVHNAQDPAAAARLLKEAQRASALNHRGIASVYDVFSTGNELLLVMEYVDGVTLRDRMRREIGVADFCAIATQCTEALAAAHRNGILHGDLKPANIMLTRDGQVKVCDFGLARRLPTSEGAAETTTQHGIAGTPAYIAPETILERPADQRADIFSLGVVFYQMLALRNPFIADGVMATLDRILHFTPEPLDRVNPKVPGKLARTIHRMLEKEPDDRTASAAEIGAALSTIGAQQAQVEQRQRLVRRVRTWAALAGVAVIAVLATPRLDSPAGSSQPPLPQPMHLIVLPFTAEPKEAASASFLEGITDALSGQLSKLTVDRDFQVVTEADRRLRRIATAVDARDQFGVNLALIGSLRYEGKRIAVTTALIDTRSGRRIRSEPFDVTEVETLPLQTRILDAATHMMEIELGPEERLRISAGTLQPGANEYYLEGRGHLLNYDRIESVESAISLFRDALKDDQKYVLAYAGLGQAYWRKYQLTRSTELVEAARGTCLGALSNGVNLAEPHICLAMVLNGTGEYEQAAEEYLSALKHDPTNDQAYLGLAKAYQDMGRQGAAEETYIQAIKKRPHYWGGFNMLGLYYFNSGRYEDALERFRQVVKLAPQSFRGHYNVGGTLFMLDQIPEAIVAFKKSMDIRPNIDAATNLGTAYYFQGQYQLAADTFREAIKINDRKYETWGNLAHTLELVGKKAEAEQAFRRARELVLEGLRVNYRSADLHVDLADHHAALGETDQARRALAEALKLKPAAPTTLFRIAVFYEARLGARDEAIAWLTKAVTAGQTWGEIDRAPELQALRKDPRFPELRKLQTPQ